jgi:phosphatidylinositol-3-phosphatase
MRNPLALITGVLLAAGSSVAVVLGSTPTLTYTPEATVTPTKVLTIIEENHSLAEAKAGMPYLMSLANGSHGAYSTGWHATTHPSLPNYIAIAGGDTFGVTTDKEAIPSPHIGSAGSVFGQALSAGKTAKSYEESMVGTCSGTSGSGYAPKHNPWVYFGAERAACQKYDVAATGFLADAKANALPNAGMLVPNQADDAHNGTLAAADNWLKARLPTVLASSDFTSGKLTVVVTFDEDDRGAGNQVLTVVLNAGMTKHGAVSTPLTHYSLTGYVDHVLGTPLLHHATAGMSAAFGLR